PKLLNPDLPDDLVRIIMRCLETNPGQRYQSAGEILNDLESGHASLPPRGTRTPLAQISLTLSARQRRYIAFAAGAVLLAAGFFAVPKTRNIILGRKRATSAAVTSKEEQPNSIAVLPFRVLGDPSKLQYVAEGLNEAISAKLSTLKEARLAPPSAVDKIDQQQPI